MRIISAFYTHDANDNHVLVYVSKSIIMQVYNIANLPLQHETLCTVMIPQQTTNICMTCYSKNNCMKVLEFENYWESFSQIS